jgi:hypothetical protein
MSCIGIRRIRVNVFVAYGRRWDDFFIFGRRRLLAVIGPRWVLALRYAFLKLVNPASK